MEPTFNHELSSIFLTITVACEDEQHASKSITLAFGGDVTGIVPVSTFKGCIANGFLHRTLKRRLDETRTPSCNNQTAVVLRMNTF